MSAELHLIGTLAHDPDGPSRLASVLEDVQPDVLAVEASRHTFEWQSTAGDRASAAAVEAITAKGADAATVAFWRRRLASEHLYYEAFTTAAYAAQHGRPLHFLQRSPGDSPEHSPGGAPETETADAMDGVAGDETDGPLDDAGGAAEALSEAVRFTDLETLQGIAAYDWRGDYARNYARARVDLEAKACLEFLLPVPQHVRYQARTVSMARRLAPVLGEHERRRVAVVCVLTQLYFSEARLTLYSQLYEVTAQRYIVDNTGVVRDHPIVLPWK